MKHYAWVLYAVEVLMSMSAVAGFSCLFSSTLCHPGDMPAEQEQGCTVDPAEGNPALRINHLPAPVQGHPQCILAKCNIGARDRERSLLGVSWVAVESHGGFAVLGCTLRTLDCGAWKIGNFSGDACRLTWEFSEIFDPANCIAWMNHSAVTEPAHEEQLSKLRP